MRSLVGLLLLAGSLGLGAAVDEPAALYDRGRSPDQFLHSVSAQRELWSRNSAEASVPLALAERLRRVNAGLRLLMVAEDWCPDSVNTIPYIVKLAALADVPARIVDRRVGQPIMQRHRAPDGRTVTPVVVLLRLGHDAGAWVERPRALQELFLSVRTHPENGERFAQRQSWYDADRGRTTLVEFVELAERTAAVGNK